MTIRPKPGDTVPDPREVAAARTAHALPERFDPIRVLGEGGMGIVHEVFDRERREVVALKMIRRVDANAIYRMKREFRALADVEHANLVRLHDLFAEGESCFFTMELVRGVDLVSWVSGALEIGQADRPTLDLVAQTLFDESAVRHAIKGVASGIEALHGAGLLHRDLKPSNVLVTENGRVVLLDFGLVADAHAVSQQTLAGSVVGTVDYMSPEQGRGEIELTTAVDLYALGVVLYELLTGRLPYEGHMLRILADKQRVDPKRPSQLIKGIPADLDDLAMRLLARDPLARPSIAEVLRVLGRSSTPSIAPSSSRESSVSLFGRDAETNELEASLSATSDGYPSVVLVRGRSGIGKSALLGAFGRSVEKRERTVVLVGRCYERETVPYKGLDGVVDALSRYLASASPEELGQLLPPNLADLGTLFPVLRRIQPIAMAFARRSTAERSKQRIRSEGFACLGELLRRIAETKTLVMIVDDVQWADDDTAAALVELLCAPNPPAMLMILGTRPDDDSPVVRSLFGKDAGPAIEAMRRVVIELARLQESAIAAIARRELGARVPEGIIATIAREALGSPFAASELVRFAREDMNQDSFSGGASIDELVRRRARSLDGSARRLLDLIAIAGEPTDAVVLLRAAGIADGDRGAIDRLRARHWVRTSQARASSLLDMIHDRMRQAIVEVLSDEERAEVHRRLAMSLEALENPPHDRLARHFAAAGAPELAYHHALAAAAAAYSALAFRRAAELYALAIEVGDEVEVAALHPIYADALMAAGRYDGAAEAWLEASRRSAGPEAREWKRRAGEAKLHAGHVDEGLAILEDVASDFGVRIHHKPWRALLAAGWERLRLWLRGLGTTIRARESIPVARLREVESFGALAVSYSTLDWVLGMALQARSLREALDVGDASECLWQLGVECGIRSYVEMNRAWANARFALEKIAPSNPEVARGLLLVVDFMSASVSGDRRTAVPLRRPIFDWLASTQEPSWRTSVNVSIVGVGMRDDLDVSNWQPIVSFIRARDEESGPYAEIRSKCVVMPDLHLRRARPDLVREWTSDAVWSRISNRDLMIRAVAAYMDSWALLYEGNAPSAFDMAKKAHERMKKSFTTHVPLIRYEVALNLARSALLIGDRESVRLALSLTSKRLRLFDRRYRLHLEAIAALSERRDEKEALERLRDFGREHDYPLVEASACWALGRLLPGIEGNDARRRYAAMIEGTGIVDPDRLMWSTLPIGDAPERSPLDRSSSYSLA